MAAAKSDHIPCDTIFKQTDPESRQEP